SGVAGNARGDLLDSVHIALGDGSLQLRRGSVYVAQLADGACATDEDPADREDQERHYCADDPTDPPASCRKPTVAHTSIQACPGVIHRIPFLPRLFFGYECPVARRPRPDR